METLVLVGASLIDGTGAEPVRGRAVVVEGDRITQVVDDARAPKGRRIDLSGCTLLPGLVNCHVHLCFGAEADPVRVLKEEPAALTALKALLRAKASVEAGVTTVRDLGGRDYVELSVRRAISDGLFSGPRIVAAAAASSVVRPTGPMTSAKPCASSSRRGPMSSSSSRRAA